jgi:hypothetical protein
VQLAQELKAAMILTEGDLMRVSEQAETAIGPFSISNLYPPQLN